ncbi:MAG: GNAT family N-acetyltransferase [Bacteroidota bacterium]
MIQLRKAQLSDLPILQHWDQQAHVLACDPDHDWNWEVELAREPDWRSQLVAELDGQAIGFLQIIDPALEDSHYWGKGIGPNKRAIDIWIGEAENLGKGYGNQMMHLALELCFSDASVTEVLIDPLVSNVKAIRFYKRLGFQFLENRDFDGDECAVYFLTKARWSRPQRGNSSRLNEPSK